METKNIPRNYMNLTIFIAGLATMSVEFGASRLLGNVFGTSNIVWAVIIGLVLVYLTVGNWLGGKWADKSPTHQTFFTILGIAGIFTGIVPLVSAPILRLTADAFDSLQIPLLAGSFLAVLILFVFPVTLLGMVTPFALRLSIDDTSKTGRISGKVSAISTVGSFVGTFFTVLVLIPLIGTYRTFIVTSLLLILISLPGLWLAKVKLRFWLLSLIGFILLIFGIAGTRGTVKNTLGMVYEKESAYNYIQVIQEGEFRFLRLNEGQGMHSIYHPRQLFYGGPWSQALIAPYFNPGTEVPAKVQRIAILGLAAGTTARQASSVYPDAVIDGFEIDPEIIQVGRQWFGMDLPNLTTYAEDARWGIAHSNGNYDIISVDAYRPPYIPPHMVTVEFFQILYEKLTPKGVITINVGRSPDDRSLVDAICSTLAQVFPGVFVTDINDSYNSIIFASRDPQSSWAFFEQNYGLMTQKQPDSLPSLAMNLTLQGKTNVKTTAQIFTDDLAPVEFLSNRIVLKFLIDNELE